jgi:citronellol/citronellal dehydrogenase
MADEMQRRSPFAPDLLAGARALVTGGGTGLGLAIARRLAGCGAAIVIAGRREDVLQEAADGIGSAVEIAPVNIRERDAVEALADRIGKVDILVNNAGGQFPHRARELSPNGWRAVIDTNLNGTWNMTQGFGNRMLDGGGGVICQIVTVVGRGVPGLVHSAAARAGVIEMSRTLAYEWGPTVRVNCVAPGPIRTEGFDDAYDAEAVKRVDGLPLMAYGTPDDVADAVTFLVSPASRYVTGIVLDVAGGQPLQGPVQVLPKSAFPERHI